MKEIIEKPGISPLQTQDIQDILDGFGDIPGVKGCVVILSYEAGGADVFGDMEPAEAMSILMQGIQFADKNGGLE